MRSRQGAKLLAGKRERNARLVNGRIAMTSQEIYASHQIGASIAPALLFQ